MTCMAQGWQSWNQGAVEVQTLQSNVELEPDAEVCYLAIPHLLSNHCLGLRSPKSDML